VGADSNDRAHQESIERPERRTRILLGVAITPPLSGLGLFVLRDGED
jgi:hypothetical protein